MWFYFKWRKRGRETLYIRSWKREKNTELCGGEIMETLKELVSRVLDVDKKELNDDSSPNNISSWD